MPTKEEIQAAASTAVQSVRDEIARYAQSLIDTINAGKLPDGSVVFSADEAQGLVDTINSITSISGAADQPA